MPKNMSAIMRVMKNKILTFAGKGGTSKSTKAAALSTVLSQNKIKHSLVSIEQHGDLLHRLCPECWQIDYSEIAIARGETGLDRLYQAAQTGHVIADTGANTIRGFVEWIRTTEFLEAIKDQEIRMAFAVFVLPDSPDCIDFLDRLHGFAGADIDWFVIESPVQSGDFSVARKKASTIGATVISLPNIAPRLLAYCSGYNCPVTKTELPREIDVLNRARIRNAGRAIASALEPLVNYIKK
jgi:hypothetical protein